MEYSASIDYFIRISIALVLGFILGFEREVTNKCAGLRTNILVCLGACVFTIISIYGFPTVLSGDNANGLRDTARVAAQVVTGIGFIGAGTVLKNGPTVFGLTTAATLWMAASIGMACGTANYDIAAFSTVISVIVLTLIRLFEKDVLITSSKNVRSYKITIYCLNSVSLEIQKFITTEFKSLENLSIKKLVENKDETKISFTLELSEKNAVDSINKKFQNVEGIESLTIRNLNEDYR